MRSKTLSLFIVVAVLALIIGGIYYLETYMIGPSASSANYSQTNSAYDVLKSSNTFYALGVSLASQGNLTAAKDAYEKALPTAADQYQAGVIQFGLATIRWASDPIGSIPALEAVATNPNYTNSTRAYALQYIGQAYNNPPIALSAAQVQQLVKVTFATSPFSAMLVNGDIALAYRQVYESADALYPLPLPEALSAQWYADQVLGSSQVSSSTLTENIAAINENFSVLDSAIQTESIDPNLNIFSAQALAVRADIVRRLSSKGLYTKADVAAAYKRAFDEYTTVASPALADGYARYNYAIALSYAYGASQADKVQSVMAPIYANPGYATGVLGIFLKSLIGSTSILHHNAVVVANIDPKFKSYLMSLGWTSADFSS